MTKTTKIVLGAFLALLVSIILVVSFVVSAKFTAERYEASIAAQDEAMQSTWAMMSENLKMQGFTVKNYSKEFIDSIKANAVRYENDKAGMMKWVQEAQSQMSPDAHKKFMSTIEKAYAAKDARQQSKISVAQEYRTWINASIKGTLANVVFNYPTEKAKKIMDRIIINNATKEAWETGVDEAKNPFESK